MASPVGLQLYFGKWLPDEVLQRIFEFGFHIWLAKPHDITTEMGEVVEHLVPFEDIKPDVCFDVRELDKVSDGWVEKRMDWAEYYFGDYMYGIEICEGDVIGLAIPRVRQEMLDFEIRPMGKGVARRITNQRGHRYFLYQCEAGYLTDLRDDVGWHFNPIHLVPPTHRGHDIGNRANMFNAVMHMMRQAQYEDDSDGWDEVP